MKTLNSRLEGASGIGFNESKNSLRELLNDYKGKELDSDSKGKLEFINHFVALYSDKWKEYYANIPDTIAKQSISYSDYYIVSGIFLWERILFGKDINGSDSVIDIIDSIIDQYFALPVKTIEWFRSASYGNFDRIADFNKTKPERTVLYRRAIELYKKENQKKRKSSYTYKRALEDANEKYKIIIENEFDLDFYNIEQGFKVWRKKQLKS